MAVSFWLPKVIVVLTFCGISCAHFDDLLDRVRVSKSNDPEVREFLTSVLRHHDDFRWIQGMLRRREANQLLPGLRGPSPKSKRSFYSAPHNYQEYYGYRMPPYRRPTNDVYPYQEDNEVQSGARNDESFFNEDRVSKRTKRMTPDAEALLNEKLMLRNILYNTRRSKMRKMFVDTDFRKNSANVDDKIEVFPNSEHGVLYAPGNKYEVKTDDIKKRACDDIYAGLEHANASDSSLSEFFYSSPHDILGISQDIAAEQHDANKTCAKYRKNTKPVRSVHFDGVFGARRNRRAKKPQEKSIKIKIYDGGRLVKDIKRGKGSNSIVLTIKNDKRKSANKLQNKYMNDLYTIKNRVNQPEDLLSQSDNTLQKIDAIIRHDQATLKLNNQFKSNNAWPPAGTSNNYLYEDPDTTAKRNTVNSKPLVSSNQKRKSSAGDDVPNDDSKLTLDPNQSGDVKQSSDLKQSSGSKQANSTGDSPHDDALLKVVDSDKQEKTVKHTLDYPLKGRSVKENRAAKNKEHKYNGKIWTAFNKKYPKSFVDDGDVVACASETQNRLEDMTEPTSAAEQRELGKINNKFSTPEMEVITTDKMMIIPFKKSNDERTSGDKKSSGPHDDEAQIRRKDEMGEVVDEIRRKIMGDETDDNKLKNTETEDKSDVQRRNIRSEGAKTKSFGEEMAANVTLSLKDSETVLDKLKVDLEKAIKSDTLPRKIRKKEPNEFDLAMNNEEYEAETPSDDDDDEEPFKIETTSRKIILRDNNDEYIDLTEIPAFQTRKLKSLEDSFSNFENDNHQIVKRGLTELFRMAHDEDYSEDKTDLYDKRKRTPEAPHHSLLQKLQIFKKMKKATKAPYRKMIRAKPKRGVVSRENIFLSKRQNEERQEPVESVSPGGGGNELDIIEKTQAILLHMNNASLQDDQQNSANETTKGEYDENDDPDVKRDEESPLDVKHVNTVRILDHYDRDDDIVGEIMKIVQKFKEKQKRKDRKESERSHRLSDYDDNEEASFSHHLHKDKHTHPSAANVHACKLKPGLDHLDPYNSRMFQPKHQQRETVYSAPRLVREGVPDVETVEDNLGDEIDEPTLKGKSRDNPLKFTPDNLESFKEIVENGEEHKKRLKRYVDELDRLYNQAKNEEYNEEFERLIAEGDEEDKIRNRRYKNYNYYDPFLYGYPRFRKAEPPFPPPPRPVTIKRDLNETTNVTVAITVVGASTTIGPSTTTVNATLFNQCKPGESNGPPGQEDKKKKKGKKKGGHHGDDECAKGHKDDNHHGDVDEKNKLKGGGNETEEDLFCGKPHKNDEGDETYDNRKDKHKGKGQETEREKKLKERNREKIKEDQQEEKHADADNLKNVLSGRSLLDLIENFHNKLKDHERIYTRFGQTIGKKCASDQVALIDSFRDKQTKQDIKHAQLMLHQVIVLMNKIVSDQVHRKTCVVLPPTVKDFLKRTTGLRVSTSKSMKTAEGYPLPQMYGKGENEGPGGKDKQSDFLFEGPDETFKKLHPEDAMKKKIQMVKNLLSKYNNMSEKCQIKVEAVKNYLVDHLGMLEKMYYENKMNEDYCTVKPGYLACNASASGANATGSTPPSGNATAGVGNAATTVAGVTTLAPAVSSKRSSLDQMKFGKLAHRPLTPLSDKYKKLVEAADTFRRKRQIEERLARLFGRNKVKEEEKRSTKKVTETKPPIRDLRDIAFESPQIYSLDE